MSKMVLQRKFWVFILKNLNHNLTHNWFKITKWVIKISEEYPHTSNRGDWGPSPVPSQWRVSSHWGTLGFFKNYFELLICDPL